MQNIDTVKQLWEEFQTLPFPHELKAHSDIYSDMGRLNTTARQCIQQYIDNGGELDAATMRLLQTCLEDMRTSNPGLTGDAQVYFGLLYRMCDLVANQDG